MTEIKRFIDIVDGVASADWFLFIDGHKLFGPLKGNEIIDETNIDVWFDFAVVNDTRAGPAQ